MPSISIDCYTDADTGRTRLLINRGDRVDHIHYYYPTKKSLRRLVCHISNHRYTIYPWITAAGWNAIKEVHNA